MQAGSRLQVQSDWRDLTPGESIALNGVCLTYIETPVAGLLTFDLSPETIQCTTLGDLKPGMLVNLERAMQLGARFGGHYVTGHIDTVASVIRCTAHAAFTEICLSDFADKGDGIQYILPKGSITVDGVSLTINHVGAGLITLMLIPATLEGTQLGLAVEGLRVNIEYDYFTKIVSHKMTLNESI
jgi:riboflavin synthase